MRRFRSVTALLVGLLFIHLTWMGSGVECIMPEMTDGGAARVADGMAGMAGMNMPDASQSATDDTGAHDHERCQLPWAPEGCEGVTSCAPLSIATPAIVLDETPALPLTVGPLLVLEPPSSVRAPELPPPRA